jgi:hypothetical protein
MLIRPINEKLSVWLSASFRPALGHTLSRHMPR